MAHGTPQQVALRSRIVLAAAEGRSDSAMARQLQVNRHTVILWRQRFQEEGKESLWEVAPGRGRKPTYGPEKIQAVVEATLQTKPKGMTQMELSTDGRKPGAEQIHSEQHLAQSSSETAPSQNVQTVARS